MNLSTFELFKSLNNADGSIELSNTELIKLQNCLFDILSDIDSFCSKNHISYFLSGGTALGAFRHKGFIPWDDDLDINMTRKDFSKFFKDFEKAFPGKYVVQSPGQTEDYFLTSGRIRLKNSAYVTRGELDENEQGIFVDIFIIENVPNNKLLRKLHGFFCLGFGFLLSCRMFYKNRKSYQALLSGSQEAKKIFKIKNTIGFCTSCLSASRWNTLTNWVYSLCKNEHSEYVSIPSGRKHYFGELYRRSGFCEKDYLEFEGLRCPVAKDLNDYLTKLYGPDYMTPPPPEKREKHLIFKFELPENFKGKS